MQGISLKQISNFKMKMNKEETFLFPNKIFVESHKTYNIFQRVFMFFINPFRTHNSSHCKLYCNKKNYLPILYIIWCYAYNLFIKCQ